MFGTVLFALDAEAPAWVVRMKLYEFISQHSESLGVAPGVSPGDLGLVAYADFRGDAGGLQILRFAQSYRQVPVFGPDATVRVIAGPGGVLGLRGAVVDGRVDYKYIEGPSSALAAEASIRYYVTKKTGLPGEGLAVRDLRLVAVPRSRSLGWAASVEDGPLHVATVVVAADPGDAQEEVHPHPALLYFNRDVAEGLEDVVDVVALAEDPGSDVLSDPVSAVVLDALLDGTPLHGSQRDGAVALADARVVAYDAAGVANFKMLVTLTPPVVSAEGSFLAPIGASGFAVQSAYVAVRSMYAWTDRFMAGRWESLLGVDSSFAPGTFYPRLMLFVNVEGGAVPCPAGAAACVSALPSPGSAVETPDEYQQPLEGAKFERVASMVLPGQGVTGPDVVAHEFGHFVDLFASPGFMDAGFTCEDCIPQCASDTTDEASPLKESFSNWVALWYLRDLYQVGQSSTSCAVTQAVSLGPNRGPHAQGCINKYNLLASFQAECPVGFGCDALGPQDASPTTGICNKSRGYRIDSFHQALWESMHAQACSLEPPHTCEPRAELVTTPGGDMLGGALIFASRVDTATYRGFADDMATHVSCAHGEAAYEAFNEILCHHGIRDCDAPTPVVCKTCGNGVAELDEACDGVDFAGKDCVGLGFAGGALMCDGNCEIVDSMCVSDGSTTGTGGASPMTGVDSDVPTTGSPGTGSPAGDSSGGDSAGSGSAQDGEGAQDGCGCATGGAPSAWLSVMLGGGAWLRRRRVKGGGVLLGALVVLASGCHTERAMGGETEGGSEAMSTSDGSSSGGDDAIDRRMFGRFHDDGVEVGYINGPEGDPERTLYFWAELEVHADGTLMTERRLCDSDPEVLSFTWEHVGGGQLLVVPEAYNPDGTFKYYADSVSSVNISPGEGCDDLVEVIQYLPESGKSDLTRRLVPGRVCAEPLSEEWCDFQFVWCEGVAPAVCMDGGGGG